MTPALRITLAYVLAFVGGMTAATVSSARAEQPAIDRAPVERLVRAEEAQARQLEPLARVAGHCAK